MMLYTFLLYRCQADDLAGRGGFPEGEERLLDEVVAGARASPTPGQFD